VTQITATAASSAAPEQVWHLLAAMDRMPEWFPGVSARRFQAEFDGERPVRRTITLPGGDLVEAVTRWDPPRELHYQVTESALPIRDHLGVIRLTPEGAGTRVDYTVVFRVPWWAWPLGVVLRLGLGAAVRKATKNLARMAAA